MRSVGERIAWLEQNFMTKKLTPWRVTGIRGREWVINHLFVPAYGWRIWSMARDGEVLCADCGAAAGVILEWSAELEQLIETEHTPLHDGRCPGLELVPIQVVVLCLPRREGKTVNVAA